jgi:hypothetical protein
VEWQHSPRLYLSAATPIVSKYSSKKSGRKLRKRPLYSQC